MALKLKYIETIINKASTNVAVVDGITTISYTTNVVFEFKPTDIIVPDGYKTVDRTTPTFSVVTDSASDALSQAGVLGLQWLKDTFGSDNIEIE